MADTIHEVRKEDSGRGFLNLSKGCLIWVLIGALFAPVACVGTCIAVGGVGAAVTANEMAEQSAAHEAAGHEGAWTDCATCTAATEGGR